MTSKAVIRTTLVIIAAVFLFAATRVRSYHPAHAYKAPDFTLQDLNGNSVRLSDLRGKAVVVNFWATWCPPCRREIPWFVDLQKQYGPQGLQIVGISMDDGGPSAISPFVRRMGINYPVLMGNSRVASLYGGADVLPTTYYIGRDGNVVVSVTGLVGEREVEENIKAALGEDHPPVASHVQQGF